jgi:hypothetical protein
VDPIHRVFGFLIISVLLALATYFIWRQRRVLRVLRADESLPPDDRRYVRNQAFRRLAGSGLMVVLAALLTGLFLLGLGDRATELGERNEAQRARGEQPVLDPEQRQFVNVFTWYVITMLLVLLGSLSIAAFDLWAIHRYGQRHRRQIQADRREMIERQVARMRSQRNGHG